MIEEPVKDFVISIPLSATFFSEPLATACASMAHTNSNTVDFIGSLTH
ncbi:hypothetical protein KZ820_13920 [Sphingomonas sp. RRHST34]|uniref:Uncharacterized protein n=1 Tax=Sphingomonas citri TaxID=2862499 RepID=A0ABS7BQE7_9SPHN|nr:hypothetical protein [Sphingomonas citri]MBW6531835.1 hypothetical protein [Sphingomonas citri]